MTQAISCFVVSYNREKLIGLCLRAARFADQLIVVDKSSTDGTAEVARGLADQVIVVPWSPTVEGTRALGLSCCVHDWILYLDDDEILSPQAMRFLGGREFDAERDVFYLPLKHHILGRFDPGAYYWPEHHPRFFRRGAIEFGPTVHGGVSVVSDNAVRISPDTGICIEHLSNSDTSGWIEKTNRYTANPDRVRAPSEPADLAAYAHARIDHWMAATSGTGDYPAAAAVLRAVYDIVDRLKGWEDRNGPPGAARLEATAEAMLRALPSSASPPTRTSAIAPETPTPSRRR